MPEGYTHVRTAKRAAARLSYTPRYPNAFAAGANGPDALFCYEVWKKGSKRRYNLPALGERMHEENTGAFLMALCRNVHTGPQIDYTLGFLCHYATDTMVHPFVYAMMEPGMPYRMSGGHGYLEIAVDSTLHEQDCGDPAIPAEDASPTPVGPELADIANLLHTALREAYQLDVPVEYLADTFQHTTMLRRLFISRYGIKRGLFWLVEPLFGGRGFITGHVSPRKLAELPETWTDPFTGKARTETLQTLLDAAEKRSAACMAAALQTWRRRLSWQQFARIIGSMSYTKGIETERSKTLLSDTKNTNQN